MRVQLYLNHQDCMDIPPIDKLKSPTPFKSHPARIRSDNCALGPVMSIFLRKSEKFIDFLSLLEKSFNLELFY